jgi:threonylcarbamoyladenosine tRNA methylthiotransferase MtaB
VQRQNPLAKIIVTGCYAQRAPHEIAALPGVTCVIGNSHKHQLAEIALHEETRQDTSFLPISALGENRELRSENRVYVSDIFAHTELLAAPVFESTNPESASADSHAGRTRPNLKVQDGCDNRCSFCVIPSVRGHSRSLPLLQIVPEVNTLVAAGYREVVISGINLGRWGRDLAVSSQWDGQRLATDDQGLESLIRAILSQTTLEKLRISSVEPMDWSNDLIGLVASSPRVAKHAHVPLQSGSDAVLRRMHRKYRPWHYREKIEKIHAAMPAAAIGADVMAGFPGETDAEFEATRRLIHELPFTYLHVFTYSARPGTPAATMPNQVPVQVARERNKILRDLAAEKKLAFMRSLVGKQMEAITLGSCSGGGPAREESAASPASPGAPVFTGALTDNYQKLFLKGRHLPNRWITVRVEGVEGEALTGAVA